EQRSDVQVRTKRNYWNSLPSLLGERNGGWSMKRCVALLGVGLAVVVGPVDGWASPPASPRLYRFGRGLMWTDGVRYAARGTTADRVRVYDTSTGRSFAVGRPG